MTSRASVQGTWRELVRTAVVGTQRTQLPALADEGAWEIARSSDDRSDEAMLLRASAVYGIARRAGRRAARPDDVAAPAPPETLRRCSAAAGADLVRIIEREPRLLPEWLAVARAACVRVAEEHVPMLLAYAAKHAEMQAPIAAVVGARGTWLGARIPEWAFAAGSADDVAERWLHGDPAAREFAFAEMRRSDPGAARDALAATWERETPRERVALLRTMRAGLTIADEPFLERCLDDKRKDVRDAAVALLVRLPDSALAERAFDTARAAIGLRKRLLQSPALDVTLPEKLTEAMRRDGMDAKAPAGMGERSWTLRQIVARVPPARLRGDLAPKAFLDSVRASEHAAALLDGLAAATASYADDAMRVAWLEAVDSAPDLLGLAWTANRDAPWSEARRDAIVAFLRDDRRDAASFALTLPGPWDARFSRAFLAYVRSAARNVLNPAYWRSVHELVTEAAVRLDPTLADASEEWPASVAHDSARKAVDALYETVHFRAAFRRNVESRT